MDLARLTLLPPAKINLHLRVVGLRPDGYHALDSVFHTVGLHDRLTLADAPSGIAFTCSDPALEREDNLVLRAARLVRARAGTKRGLAIHLEKGIPVGAGLGGGSSDAAATLVGLNRLWGLGWPEAVLAELAAELGSDVPFFLHGGAARVTGRGEEVAPVPPETGTWCLLLNPGVAVSTARVFAAFDREKAPPLLTPGASASIMSAAPWGSKAGVPDSPVNDLEEAACRVAPQIAEALAALRAAGGAGARMTGSGGTVFCLAPSRTALEGTQARLKLAPHWKVWLVPLTGAGIPGPGNGDSDTA